MDFGASKFAELIEVSRQQVNNYTKQGMPSIKRGKYNYYNFEAIQWLYDNGIKQINRATDSEDIEKLTIRERKELADAKLKEFELDVKMSKYIKYDIASANGTRAGIFVRETISSIPDRFIPRLALDEDTKHYLRVELKKELYDALVKISNFAKG
jgi:phage terminase Nu1 subunit (DNA packaging protein)